MTKPELIYRAEPGQAATLGQNEAVCFPILFADDPDYFTIDRMAGVWLALGLIVIVEKTQHGYRLTLDHPEAVPENLT